MAHFAKVNSSGIVEEVLVVDNTALLDDNGVEQETLGISHLTEIFGDEGVSWVQTSYNGRIRGIYAQVGGSYDSSADIFIPVKDFPSWVWDSSSSTWVSPVPVPEIVRDSLGFIIETIDWDEETLSWIITKTPYAHFHRISDEGDILNRLQIPVRYILDEQGNEDDNLGIILAIDHDQPGNWVRVPV